MMASMYQKSSHLRKAKHCPFLILQSFIEARKPCCDVNEPFFVFGDGSPVKPNHMCNTLRKLLMLAGFVAKKLWNT